MYSLLFILLLTGAHAVSDSLPTGDRLIVLNKSDNTAWIIDRSTFGQADSSRWLLAVLPTGTGPHEVAVAPNGARAVITNYGSREVPGHTLTVINPLTLQHVRDIDLGSFQRPHGIAFLKDSRHVWVTAEAQASIIKVDIEAGQVVDSLRTDQQVSHMLVITPDERLAFVSNIGSGTVSVLDLQARRHLGNIPTGAGAEGMALTPDGREVWVTNRAANTVSLLSVDSLKVIATLPAGDFPIRIAFTPDGRRALVSNARSGDVTIFDVKERKAIGRISLKAQPVADRESRIFAYRFGDSPVPVGLLIPPGTAAYVALTNADALAIIDWKKLSFLRMIRVGREPDGLGLVPTGGH